MTCNINYEKIIFSIHKKSRFNDNNQFYVFIGSVDIKIKNILDKLENRKSIPKEEVILLKNNYPHDYINWINIVKNKIKIYFLPYYIQIDDTISDIRKKIFIYLSNPDKQQYILPENQELWFEKNNGKYEIVGYYYENDVTKEKENFIPQVYEKLNIKNNENSFNKLKLKKNTSENNLIIMDLLNENNFIKNVIYLSDATEEELYLKSKKINITKNLINNYFKKYWPYVNLSYDLNETKNNYIIIKDYLERENYIFHLINTIDINKNEFGVCNLLNAVINVGDKSQKEYLDLFQIFDYLRENQLGTRLPFIEYAEESIDIPITLVSKKAIEEGKIDKDTLNKWLDTNNKEESRRTNGIQLKKYSKDYNNKPKYYSMLISKMGMVQINIGFTTENNATFDDVEFAINDCRNFLDNINKNRILKKIGEKSKIELPELTYDNGNITLNNLTHIKYMNFIIPINLGQQLDFKKLYEFSKKFPYFLVDLPKNIIKKNNDGSKVNKLDNSLTIKYKRISGFVNMNDILFEIDKLKEKNIESVLIIKLLEKKYHKSIDEIKSYLLEWEKRYSSSKSSKISSEFKQGILVTITENKILIKGITKIYQIPLIYNFFTTFLTLFIHYDNYLTNKNFRKAFTGKNINENAILFKNSYEYESNTNLKLNLEKINYTDYNIETYDDLEEQYMIKDNEDELKRTDSILSHKFVGMAALNEVGTDVKLTCDDAIPEKFTCKDTCNDEYYFIRRLQIFDPKLFKPSKESKEEIKKYTKACQAKYQPVVLAVDPEKDPRIKKESYTYSVKYSSEPNLFDRWYICPKVWCPICEIPISDKDIDPKTIKIRATKNKGRMCKTGKCPYGDHLVIIKEKSGDIYPGFLSKDSHPQGLCMPCCYKKPKNIPGTPAYASFKKCLGDDNNVNNINTRNGEVYILGKGVPIEKNRYGKLSIDLERILKTKLDTGYLKNKSGYLRKGINHTKNNSFLSAIADIINCDKLNPNMDVKKIKSLLIERLNEDLFKSLHSGNLQNIFYNIENFIKYLENDNIEITHKYLWDFLQRENIISDEGLNIFIFENNNLLCPLGENIKYFYKEDRKSIILVKSHIFYEPVYYIEGLGKTTQITCMYDNSREEIKKIYDISQEGCVDSFAIDWIAVLKNNIVKYNLKINNENIYNGYDLQKTLNEILINVKNKRLTEGYLPVLQYIDSYNKVFGIELKNGLYLPVAPTKLNEKMKYKLVMNLNDINKLSFKDTINYTTEIYKKTKLNNIKITNKILDLKHKKNIIALVNESNRFIPIIEIANNDKILKISNLNYYSDVDEALFDKVEQLDNRIEVINKKKFEDETFMRLKFELSKFLQLPDNKKFFDKILEIINSESKNYTKNKTSMYILLNTIFSNLITTKKDNIDFFEYNTPNKRIPCFMRDIKNKKDINRDISLGCEDDPHCVKEKGKCKLFLNQTNLIYKHRKINNYNFYLSKIVDELLRYKLKRNEILKDNIPVIINKEIIPENNNKYIIFHTLNNKDINNTIEKLFYDNKGILINTKSLYEETTTKDIAFKKEKYLKTTIQNINNLKSDDLSSYWTKYLGNNYKIRLNVNDSLFNILIDIINLNEFKNNRNNEKFNINTLKKHITNYFNIKKNKEDLLDLYHKNKNKKLENIPNIEILKQEIINKDYKGSEADLLIFSKIYNINFIILDKNVKNNIGFKIIKSKNYKTDYFVLLYKTSIFDNYLFNIIHSKNKIIFKYSDLPNNFVNFIFKNNNNDK